MAIKNIIIVSIDCLRKESISCYDERFNSLLHKNIPLLKLGKFNCIYKYILSPLIDIFLKFSVKPRTPCIDQIASDGAIFTQAVTQAPFTPAAHASLFTGLNPFRHGIRAMVGFRLNTKVRTLAEVIKNHGYRTAGFIGSNAVGEYYGLNKGFDIYDFTKSDFVIKIGSHEIHKRKCEQVSRFALDWLSEVKNDKFLLFLHFFDCHEDNKLNKSFQPFYQISQVEKIDQQIANIITFLKSNNIYEDTALIICSDHGNDFGIHEPSHMACVFDTTILIPLIIKAGKSFKGEIIEKQVRLIDVTPTILDLLGFLHEVDSASLDGVSLLDKENIKSDQPAYCETMSMKSTEEWKVPHSSYACLRNPEWKLVLDRINKSKKLYNLRSDTFEVNNVYDKYREVAELLFSELLKMTKNDIFIKDFEFNMPQETIEETKKILRSLGYL